MPCPPDADLRRLLDGALPDPARAGVEDHVDRCEACQARLADLTGGDTVAQRLRGNNGPAGRRPTPSLVARTFLGRVRAAGDGVSGPTVLFPGGPGAAPPVVAGYEVLEELGRGGMGVVWKARDVRLNRPVALKMLLDSKYASPEVRLRFLIEAEAVARLQHPGIVQVYEFGGHDGQPYLAMEYVGGGTLAGRLGSGGRFAPREAAGLVARLADAVAAAHRAGVVHRDLKPANILLQRTGDGGRRTYGGSTVLCPPSPVLCPKVTDFGLAKLDRSDLTRTGALMGTPQYMAPEQAAGRVREVGTPTDVWALGVILYELLTGRPPFTADAPLDVLSQVLHTPPRPPRADGRRVPRDLQTVCLKCLEKDPRKRYAGADALAADLRAFLDGRAISARPAGWWERAGRFVRRNPVPTAAAAVLLAGAVGAFAWVNQARVSEGLARRAAERREADAAFDQAVLRCQAGEIEQGLADFARAADLAAEADHPELARVARANAAAWGDRLPRVVARYDPPAAGRSVEAVAFAVGGRLVVTAGSDGTVRVWDREGQPARVLPPPEGLARPAVVGVVPNPPDDGVVFVAHAGGVVRRWDVRTGSVVGTDFDLGPGKPVRSVAVDPAGEYLAVGDELGFARTWRLTGYGWGDRVGDPLRRHLAHPHSAGHNTRREVTGVGFFREKGRAVVAVGSRQGGASARPLGPPWEVESLELTGEVHRLAARPGRAEVLIGGESAAGLWPVHDRGRPRWVQPHPQQVGAVAFSPDGRRCATADLGGNVRCWDPDTGLLVAQLRHPDQVRAVAFDPAGDELLVGGLDGAAVRWRLPSRPDRVAAVPDPFGGGAGSPLAVGMTTNRLVGGVGFLPGGRFWTVTPPGLRVWEPTPDGGFRSPPNPLFFSPDKQWNPVRAGAASPDGKYLVTGGLVGHSSRLWDATAERKPAGPPLDHPAAVAAAGFLPDGRSFFTLTEGPGRLAPGASRLHWWRIGDAGAAPDRPAWPALPDVLCAAPHPDGGSVLVGQRDGQPTGFRSVETGEPVGPPLAHPGAVTAAAVHPDGRLAATGGRDGVIRLWAVAGGREVGRPMYHADRVNQLVFVPGPADGLLVSAGDDGTARFWDARTGLPVGPPLRHPEAVLGVALDPAGGRVLTAGRDGAARFWPVPAPPGD